MHMKNYDSALVANLFLIAKGKPAATVELVEEGLSNKWYALCTHNEDGLVEVETSEEALALPEGAELFLVDRGELEPFSAQMEAAGLVPADLHIASAADQLKDPTLSHEVARAIIDTKLKQIGMNISPELVEELRLQMVSLEPDEDDREVEFADMDEPTTAAFGEEPEQVFTGNRRDRRRKAKAARKAASKRHHTA